VKLVRMGKMGEEKGVKSEERKRRNSTVHTEPELYDRTKLA